MTKVKQPSEHAEQVAFVQWFRATYPGVLIFAIPNGGNRNPVTGLKLKLEGVTPGIPDIFIPQCNLWVEMKRARGGSVSPDQKAIHAELIACGHSVIIARGALDGQKQVLDFINKEATK